MEKRDFIHNQKNEAKIVEKQTKRVTNSSNKLVIEVSHQKAAYSSTIRTTGTEKY